MSLSVHDAHLPLGLRRRPVAYNAIVDHLNEQRARMPIANYEGLRNAVDEANPHLGGSIKEGDPFTHSPAVWDYLINRFAVKSVLDLGSGGGYASHYFFKRGCQVLAVDGLKENVDKSTYPVLLLDVTRASVYCRVDLVHCQEFVEHIEETYLENLMLSLTCGKFIVMTHALPGQGGYHHVNLREPEYWIEHLKRYNCEVLSEDTKRVRDLAKAEGAIFLAKTGLVLANRSLL